MTELPAEAELDREVFGRYDTKSGVYIRYQLEKASIWFVDLRRYTW